MGTTCGAGTAYPSGEQGFTPECYNGVSVAQWLVVSVLCRTPNIALLFILFIITTADEKYQFTCSVVFSATVPSWKGLISVT